MSITERKWSALTCVSRMVSSGSAVGTSTSPLPYHLNSLSNPDSPGPAM